MSQRVTFARRIGWLAGLSCLPVVAACGSLLAPASMTAGRGHGIAARVVRNAATAKADSTRSARAGFRSGGDRYVKHADFLTGVSCPSPGHCTAVGWYYYGSKGPQLTLIERWNGAGWQAEPSPRGGRDGTLASVSCPTATGCTAVGSLIIGLTGSRWRVQRQSSPFDAVSCASAISCLAVGVTASDAPVYGQWNGARWAIGRMPRPPHTAQHITLAGVSCSGPDSCVAVGDYSYGVGAMPSPTARDRTLAEQWNGTRWQVMATANATHWNALSAVSCASPLACTAVGSSGSGQFALAERWDGTSWQLEHVPDPSRTGYTSLTAVSCSSARACMAAGSYQDSPVAESWGRSGWKLLPMPRPPGAGFIQLGNISCTGPAACVAVGADGATFAEIWNGSRWRVTPTPSPS